MPPPTSAAATAPLMLLARQSLGQDASNVKNTFSSWDNCMAESYCKYPVIIAIVIASLIALSIIFCVVRCCCCGLECCCGICACFNACCPSPRGRRDRTNYRDPEGPPPFKPSPYQGYQSSPAPFYNSQPQYAQFETGRGHSGGEDSLPAMPSWDNAASRRVEDHHAPEEMELGKIDLDHEQKAPMLANQAPAPHGGQGGYGAYSDGMPYQQHIASNGGDLGVYSQPPTYRGAQTTAPAVAGAGAAAAGRQTPNSGYNYGSPQQQRPALEPGYNSYGSQGSSGYTGPSSQGHGAPSPPQQAYGGAQYQQNSGSLPSALSSGQQNYQPFQGGRKPVEGSWKDV